MKTVTIYATILMFLISSTTLAEGTSATAQKLITSSNAAQLKATSLTLARSSRRAALRFARFAGVRAASNTSYRYAVGAMVGASALVILAATVGGTMAATAVCELGYEDNEMASNRCEALGSNIADGILEFQDGLKNDSVEATEPQIISSYSLHDDTQLKLRGLFNPHKPHTSQALK